MDGIEDTTLFGKYQLCRVLGRGRSGTVYLAKHQELEEYRAIKQVPKTCSDYGQFRKEALILKDIRHPGIPIVYDVMEDENFSYLVEEFLEGDSLYALVSCMGPFSKAMTVRYGIQICHLVSILHSASPNPILYLDLQPKNLLVCDDTVKLVDFDHAIHLSEAGQLTKRYGTVGFAAPEQYTGDMLDERTDIYAIGAALYYMLTGQFPGEIPIFPKAQIDGPMKKVIGCCLRKDSAQRYASVARLVGELEKIQKEMERKQGVFRKESVSSLTIAVAGASSGVGTTHVAMGLAAFLQRRGWKTLYEERNESGAVRQMASQGHAGAGSRMSGRKQGKMQMDSCGICQVGGLPMLPFYGEAVKLERPRNFVIVRDYGADRKKFSQEAADGYLLVCGSKPWEWERTRDAVQFPGNPPGTAVIYNHFCRQLSGRLPRPAKGTACFLMPYDTNPLSCGVETQKIYEEIWNLISGSERKREGRLRAFLKKEKAFLAGFFRP